MCIPPRQFPLVPAKQVIPIPAYDELYAKQQTTLDFEARKAIVWEMQKIVHDDVVYIIPFYEQATQAFRTDRFTGWITDQAKVELSDVTSLGGDRTS